MLIYPIVEQWRRTLRSTHCRPPWLRRPVAAPRPLLAAAHAQLTFYVANLSLSSVLIRTPAPWSTTTTRAQRRRSAAARRAPRRSRARWRASPSPRPPSRPRRPTVSGANLYPPHHRPTATRRRRMRTPSPKSTHRTPSGCETPRGPGPLIHSIATRRSLPPVQRRTRSARAGVWGRRPACTRPLVALGTTQTPAARGWGRTRALMVCWTRAAVESTWTRRAQRTSWPPTPYSTPPTPAAQSTHLLGSTCSPLGQTRTRHRAPRRRR